MDETVVNGAQIFYKKEFSIDDDKDSVSAELAQRSKSSTKRLTTTWIPPLL